MSNNVRADRPPVVVGAIAGVIAWLLGYVFTFLIAGPEVQDSTAQRFIEAVQGEPSTYEMVGWVFYNAHFVDTVFVGIPLVGDQTTNAIGSEGGVSMLLYLIPVGLLLAAGLAVGRFSGSESPTDGAFAGLTVVPGYLVLTLLGLFVFEVTIGGATGRPAQLEAVVIAGILYPVILAAAGGVLAAVTQNNSPRQSR